MHPLRVALVEPNEPDMNWFRMVVTEIRLPATLFHYSTGIQALNTWRERGVPSIDVIVISDVLPMLTSQEFLDGARMFYPGVPVVVVGEQIQLQPMVIPGIKFVKKPLAADDIRTIREIVSDQRTQSERAELAA